MTMYGLKNINSSKQVPLNSIIVKVTIQDFAASVTSKLVYENQEDVAIEAQFLFPADESSAVYKFEVDIDGRVIIGECQEKQQAKETYNDAMARGHGAFLLKEDDNTGDIFEMKIGNLPPHKTANVTFSYVVNLCVESDGSVQFKLPTILNPRYNPKPEDGDVQVTTSSSYWSGSEIPYQLHFFGHVSGSTGLKKIICTDPLVWEKTGETQAKITLTDGFKFNSDIEFSVVYEDLHKPSVVVERGSKQQAGILQNDVIMLNFFPQIDRNEISSNSEFIFIVDRSGSMSGNRIDQAKDTLLLFLKSLPVGCYFNVISFGSNFQCLFPQNQKYDEESLCQALDLQSSMGADLGGTEILRPLKHVYENLSMNKGFSRQVFLLTDGGVSNPKQVIDLIKKHSHHTRVFTFGIGCGASTTLVKGAARAGKGKAHFVSEGDKLQAKVVSCLETAIQPAATDICLQWETPGGISVTNIPEKPPVVFAGEHLVAYGLVQAGDKTSESIKARLSAKIGETAYEETLEFSLSDSVYNSDFLVHRLAAKALIKELEEQENEKENKDKITLVSVASNIVSRHTAFVGVDRLSKETSYEPRNIPVPSDCSGDLLKCAELQRDAADTVDIMRQNLSQVLDRSECLAGLDERSCGLMAESKFYAGAYKLQRKTWYSGVTSSIGDKLSGLWSGATSLFSRKDNACHLPVNDALDSGPVIHQSAMSATQSRGQSREQKCSSDSSCNSPLQKVIVLQRFDGSWQLDEELVSHLGVSLQAVKDICPTKDTSVWATVLAVVWLDVQHMAEKDEWSIIAVKAVKWVEKQLHDELHSLEELKEKAREILNK